MEVIKLPTTNHGVSPRIGDIYLMRFDGVGSEQTGWRPGLVFQNNAGNKHSPNIIALPLTSSTKKPTQPTHIFISSADTDLLRDSIVLCENPQRMSKQRIGRFLARLPDYYMKQIASAYLIASSAISFLDKDTLLSAWEEAIRLNSN